MTAITLPLTFANSFWTEDYRRGLETLFDKLVQGVAENDEIVAFIRARAAAEHGIAEALTRPAPLGPRGTGFNADEGASLLMTFGGLQAESVAQGEVHRAIAKELESLVVDPFEDWARGHKSRISSSRNAVVDGYLKTYEIVQGEVDKLKHQYLDKTRRADEAEDDAKFAPNNDLSDNYTSSPRMAPRDPRNPPQRTASVSERIAQRFKELQRQASPTSSRLTDDSEKGVADGEVLTPAKIDKGKGRAVDETPKSPEFVGSPPPMSPALPPAKIEIKPPSPMPAHPPPPILLAGLALPPSAVSDLLKRAASEMPLRPVKFPLIGEYKDCFTGEDFVVWLVDNVPGLGGSLDRAEDAAKDLCEREGILRRIGEFGNAFENTDEAFYQFRPKAFDLHAEYVKQQNSDSGTVASPVITNLAPVADTLVKRSNTFFHSVQKAINSNATSEPKYIRLRAEADAADKTYRVAVRKLDRQRLSLEERVEDTFKVLQKWELDRLRAVKTVLLQYHGTLANLPSSVQSSLDRSSTLIASYQAESDLRALIEQYRTGPFKPVAQVYESVSHDEADVYFGIDLRKWADGGWSSVRGGEERNEKIPEVLSVMLQALNAAYAKLPNDAEKRKSWIYEVPLPATHHVREALNAVPPGLPIPVDILEKYDVPVLASTVKLWALELNPPLCTWEGWDDIRRIYPAVGASTNLEENEDTQQRIQDLQVALQRLPKVHLHVLEAIFGHLQTLIETTSVEESNDIYITKLALSTGRTILRPRHENEKSIQDRHPTLLFIDLLQHYAEIIPPTISKKKRESERKVPIRKRTAPIDMRVSRSRLSVGVDPREVLEAQMAAKNPNMKRSSSPAPPMPPLPTSAPTTEPTVPPPPIQIPAARLPHVPPPPPVIPLPPPLNQPATPLSIPPPPPLVAPQAVVPLPPPPIVSPVESSSPPPRPSFREPPPEDDSAPPMPRFKSPPPETDDAPFIPPGRDGSPAEVTVAPPTPKLDGVSPGDSNAPSRMSPLSAPEPASVVASPIEERPGASLSRAGSSEASRLRGPRVGGAGRGPRPISQNISAVASNFNRPSSPLSAQGGRAQSPSKYGGGGGGLHRANRSSVSSMRSGSPVNPHDYEPKKRGGRAQAGAFSRRTMASDAEDDITK